MVITDCRGLAFSGAAPGAFHPQGRIEHYRIGLARGSALDCGAVQDVLQACGARSPEQDAESKMLLDRIVARLAKLGQCEYVNHEEPGEYRAGRNDTDSDTDPDGNMKPENRQPSAAPNPVQGRIGRLNHTT
jgi:hypothetical protein